MEIFFDLLEILGHWLVFSFSLYEGLLNLGEHAAFAKKYEKSIYRIHFNLLERLIIPLYFRKLKDSVIKIAKDHNATVSEAEDLLKLIDRAILWIYLSIGGWLVWLCALFLLVKDHIVYHSILIYLAFAVLGTALSIFNVKLRIKKRRQRLCELAECNTNEEVKIGGRS